jgi:hypothetical protein
MEALMKPTDLIPLLAAVDNGWGFAAVMVGLAAWLYVNRRDR